MFTNARLFTKKSLLTPGLTVHLLVVTNISCQNYNWSTADTEATTNSSRYHDSNICSVVQLPLVIVDPVIVEFLVIEDRFCRPIVYFSMYFSRNSGITR